MKISALLSIAILLTSCAINPQRVGSIPTKKNFNALSCQQLDVERERLEKTYAAVRWSKQYGTRIALRILNGEVAGVTDAMRANSCKSRSPRIPGSPRFEQKLDNVSK